MIELDNVTVAAGSFRIRDVRLVLPAGAYGILMGKTGSGKTTVLEAVCGLRRVVSGRILLGERDVTSTKPAERGIGFVPQDGALFESMPVREQLAFALRIRRRPASEIRERVQRLAELLAITPLLDRHIGKLSGGERQRVALGRALSFAPSVLCLDEPLSALDQDTRLEMCDLLQRVQAETRVTVLHITHDRNEAARLADHLFRIEDGRVNTVSPRE